MGCGCGKGGGKKSVAVRDTANTSSNVLGGTNQDDLVAMQYTGSDTNKVGLRSKYSPRDRYTYSKDESRFSAYRADVEWLLSLGIFKVVEESLTSDALINDLLPLQSNIVVPNLDNVPVDVLSIDSVIIANLRKNGYETLQSIKLASDGELLALKGMGSKRLKELRRALVSV